MKKRSKVSKKVFLSILLMELIVVVSIFCIIILDNYSNNFGTHTIVSIVILLLFGIIPFALKSVLKSSFEDLEICKESERYVQKNLSKEHLIEVIPIKDEPQHEDFVTKELVRKAKFYAQLMNNGTVLIYIKFNDEDNLIYYSWLYAEDFTTHFKVINL